MFTGELVNLRPMKLNDWKKTIVWRNDPIIKNLAMMHPFPITEYLEKEWYVQQLKSKSNKVVYYTITDKNDIPIGFIFLNNISFLHRNCYLGIVVGENLSRGKGAGSEAVRLISSYAFNVLNLNKITVEVVDCNAIAIRVYEKLGFINEGCLKQQYFANGEFFNVIIMSLFNK